MCVFIHAITYMYDKHTDIVFNAGQSNINNVAPLKKVFVIFDKDLFQ